MVRCENMFIDATFPSTFLCSYLMEQSNVVFYIIQLMISQVFKNYSNYHYYAANHPDCSLYQKKKKEQGII